MLGLFHDRYGLLQKNKIKKRGLSFTQFLKYTYGTVLLGLNIIHLLLKVIQLHLLLLYLKSNLITSGFSFKN